ncbi:MAG: sulfite exporter TauE/SafE family protein [bacterium]
MLKKIKFQIKKIHTQNDKYTIETEIDILAGVKNVDVDWQAGECLVEFDDDKISKNRILESIKKLGYEAEEKNITEIPSVRERVYFVQGMHCASCELIIEKKLLKEKGVRSVEASANKNQIVVEYEGDGFSLPKLNELFVNEDYVFFDQKIKEQKKQHLFTATKDGQLTVNKEKLNDFLVIAGSSLMIIIGFIILSKSGLSAMISVNAKSSLPMFLVFGLLAGLSSCAALVGGIVLSMSKQWSEIYSGDETVFKKLQPHFLFNLGRLISYGVLGAVLGAIGSTLQLSLTFSSILMFAVSVIMIFLSLQMLGVKYFQRFQISTPKFITRYVADEKNFNGRYMPMLMGAMTFFLPCGFTITAQGLALLSGSVLQGGLIMLFFALGTLPVLLAIGLSSVKFSKQPHLANRFLKVAGVLILFFAIFNINAQLNVLGWGSLNDLSFNASNATEIQDSDLPPIVGGKQILKMDAMAYGYEPNKLKVRAGIPVRWEITDKGTSGCTNAVMSRGLFDGEISLTPGKVSVKEFTPKEPGKYKFSCWMGMVSGTIEVVGEKGNSPVKSDSEIIPSGAKGCGCGGGGTGTCGG